MSRLARYGVALGLILLPYHVGAQSSEWQRADDGLSDRQLQRLAVDPHNPQHLSVSSLRAVYHTIDGGAHWQQQLRVPSSAEITSLTIDPFDSQQSYVATTQGMSRSSDGGRRWQWVFRNAGEASRCYVVLAHPTRRHLILLGTAVGLFVSENGGDSWEMTALTHRPIEGLAIDPHQPDRIYALTDHELFQGSLTSPTWTTLFTMTRATPEESPELSEAVDPDQVESSEGTQRLTAIAIDPHAPEHLYVASLNGLYRSEDEGQTWERIPAVGMSTDHIRHVLLFTHLPVVIYAATPQGVARYTEVAQQWETLTAGLPSAPVNFLATTPTKLFAATDQGVFALDLLDEHVARGDWPSLNEVLADVAPEPTIAQTQQAAIRYAEVQPEKIQRWRRLAAMRALLPSFNMGFNRDQGTYIASSVTSTSSRVVKTDDPSSGMDFSMKWDLSDLVWSDAQTSIDVRSKLMVQLRDDIVNEVTRTYFERRRLQIDLVLNPPKDSKTQFQKELRLQELTALLDGLTGGWFSKQTKKS